MSLDNLITPDIKVNLFGKEWKVNFTLRNFAALKHIHNVSENDLFDGLNIKDTNMILLAIWASTLVFDAFDPADPIKIKEQMNLEELYNISFADLQKISNQVMATLIASLPTKENKSADDAGKKKMPARKKKAK